MRALIFFTPSPTLVIVFVIPLLFHKAVLSSFALHSSSCPCSSSNGNQWLSTVASPGLVTFLLVSLSPVLTLYIDPLLNSLHYHVSRMLAICYVLGPWGMGEGPVSSHHHWTDRLLRVVSEQQLLSLQAYIKLRDYQKALVDCDWALKVRRCFLFHRMEWGWLGPEASVLEWVERTCQCVVVGRGRGTAIRASVSFPRKQLE